MVIDQEKHCVQCFRVLADETRLELLGLLLNKRGSSYNVSKLTQDLGVTQPTVSHHLKALRNIGMVNKEKRGREALYQFNEDYLCKGCGVFSAPLRI